MEITIHTNENWTVNKVLFQQESEESVDKFKIAVSNALINGNLADYRGIREMIEEAAKKNGSEGLYYSVSHEPPWVISFATIPFEYAVALREKERNECQ